MEDEGRTIHILWTGGLDSTFRVVELSRRKCTIQPHYISTRKKKSLSNELEAIKTMTRILKSDRRTQATLMDPIIVRDEEIPRNTKIFDSWIRLMKGKSWQYYTLAKYACFLHTNMEMGLQFSPNGSVARHVDETLLVPHPDTTYDALIIDKSRADEDTINVFGSFCFPKSLYHKNKKEEFDILQKEGYKKVLKHVWFCFHPMWGYPCGHCLPCKSTEIEGIKLPRIGKILYAIHHFFKKKKSHEVYRLNYNYTIQEVSDVFVALAKDIETDEVKKVVRLNDTGVLILEALRDGANIDEIAKRMTDAYDVDYATAKSGVEKFIAKLNQ